MCPIIVKSLTKQYKQSRLEQCKTIHTQYDRFHRPGILILVEFASMGSHSLLPLHSRNMIILTVRNARPTQLPRPRKFSRLPRPAPKMPRVWLLPRPAIRSLPARLPPHPKNFSSAQPHPTPKK